MKRRDAIGNIVLLSLGAMVTPSCTQKEERLLKYKNISITASEENLLAWLAGAILPRSNHFIGAADVNAHEFTLMMVDDCYDPEKQKKYVAGLRQFHKEVKEKYGGNYTSFTPAETKEWLNLIENKKDNPADDVRFFYQTSRRHVVQAFTSSKEYMTEVLKYKMVPGSNFKGCVPVKIT